MGAIMHFSKILPDAHEISFIVCDVDGTLLTSDHELHPRTLQTLSRLRKTQPDLPIIMATGKQARSISTLRKILELGTFPASHLNGCIVYASDGNLVKSISLKPPLVTELILSNVRRNMGIYVYDETNVYEIRRAIIPGENMAAELRQYGENVISLPMISAVQAIRRGELVVYKIGLAGTKSMIMRAKEDLVGRSECSPFQVTQAIPSMIELMPAAASKGASLLEIAGLLKLDATRALAFGDGENDMSMFKVVGWSCAMKNSVTCLLHSSDYRTDSNDEGGVGRFLDLIYGSRLSEETLTEKMGPLS